MASRTATTLRSVDRADTFISVTKVRVRRRGATTITSQHQVTLPVAALRAAGLAVGDRLIARPDGPGRVVLEREHETLAEFVGALTGVYRANELDLLRDEWG
jgi:bifunctional DNA-binding transcriptional regulator/antitoxin component of YhaV-PrlF toxin-antitoxin module